jgi:hypothetical protein
MEFYTGNLYRHVSLYCNFNYIMEVINNFACRHADIYTGYWWVTKSLSQRKISGKKNRQKFYYVPQSYILLIDLTCYSIPWHLKSLNTETFRSMCSMSVCSATNSRINKIKNESIENISKICDYVTLQVIVMWFLLFISYRKNSKPSGGNGSLWRG